jgi:hypothetical protein
MNPDIYSFLTVCTSRRYLRYSFRFVAITSNVVVTSHLVRGCVGG